MSKFLFVSCSKQNHSEVAEWLNDTVKKHEELYDIDEITYLNPQYTYIKDGVLLTSYTHCVYVRLKAK